jgi:hypothetical protein
MEINVLFILFFLVLFVFLFVSRYFLCYIYVYVFLSLYDNLSPLQFCFFFVSSEITTSRKQIKTVDSSDCPHLCC